MTALNQCDGFCPIGRFGAHTGLTAAADCAACAVDSVSTDVGQSDCYACGAGYVPRRTASGALRCTACPPGSFEQRGVENHTCALCPEGRIAPALSTTCSTCEAGSFPEPELRGQCIRCRAHAYHAAENDRGCMQCPSAGTECVDSFLQVSCWFAFNSFVRSRVFSCLCVVFCLLDMSSEYSTPC